MTRGKYKSTSEARQAREGALKAAASSERDLIAANRRIAELETLLDVRSLEFISVTDSLRRQIVAKTSPRVSELETALAEQELLVSNYVIAAAIIDKSFGRMWDALQDAYEALGLKESDAHERKLRVARYIPFKMSDEYPGFVPVHDIVSTGGSKYAINHRDIPEDPDEIFKMHRLQRAKGLRK